MVGPSLPGPPCSPLTRWVLAEEASWGATAPGTAGAVTAPPSITAKGVTYGYPDGNGTWHGNGCGTGIGGRSCIAWAKELWGPGT